MPAVRCSKVASLVLKVVDTHSMSEVATMRLAHVTTVARGLPVKIIHSFSILSDERSKASSKTMSPHSAI